MFTFRRWWLLCGAVLVGVVALNGMANDVADAQATVEAPQPVGDARTQLATKSAVTMVVCVEQSSSRLFQAVANRCDTASQFKLVWPVRGAAPQMCVNTLSREMTLSSSGTCRAENAFLARATAKRPFLGCADKDTGMLRWPRTGVCWWQNTSMVLMAAAETSTTTTSSSTTTTTSSTTTTSTTTTTVPSVVAPVLVSVSASDGVQITVAGMRPDTGVYSLQWVLQGSTFNTYQMARATSPSMSVPAGWFACNRTYTFRVFVMQAGWQLADGHQTQNVTHHSIPFDVVMPACPAATVPAVACADGGVCVVGDTGPGGGIVFYVQASGGTFTCGVALTSTCRYLEAAPTDQSSSVVWATAVTACYNADGTTDTNSCLLDSVYSGDSATQAASRTASQAIGMGMANTNQIHSRLTTVGGAALSTYAAGIAFNYENNGKIDWHLPSLDELHQLLTLSVRVGGFSGPAIWSSSEVEASRAWRQNKDNLSLGSTRKDGLRTVRAVRAFGGTLACADGGVCAVGDTGPGGGVVYILSNTSGNTTGLTFEAARNDWDGAAPDGTARWCSASTVSIAGLGTAIGTGSSNSATIATTCASTCALDAAEYVRGKTIGGKTDWFLPSRDEALAIYTQRSVFIGNYAINQLSADTARYLTSTQGANVVNALGAFLQGSSSPGDSGDFSKDFDFSVRPVRSFTAGT